MATLTIKVKSAFKFYFLQELGLAHLIKSEKLTLNSIACFLRYSSVDSIEVIVCYISNYDLISGLLSFTDSPAVLVFLVLVYDFYEFYFYKSISMSGPDTSSFLV